jgi:hypothetical protein
MSLWKRITGVEKTAGTNDNVSVETHEGTTSILTVPGEHKNFAVHLDAQGVATATGFMLVDLSDTTNWPHVNTGHVDLEYINIQINPSTSYRGDINVGWLENVNTNYGDLKVLYTWHFDQASSILVDQLNFGVAGGFHAESDRWFGFSDATSVLWQTDVNIQGPDGATSYPSGDGDFVLRVGRTAGDVDVSILVGYTTEA